jgi:pimeloyl-ACP methyl ester carboxylesterase
LTTVLLVPGALSFGNTATLTAACGGGPTPLLRQLGDPATPHVVPVPYNDWDTFSGYLDGATKINQAMLDVLGNDKIVVFCHSYGSVSACQWLRQYGPMSPIDPARVTFVLLGNSVRPGASGATPNGLCAQWNLYGGVGPDVTTRYRVYDCARQWDKWADYPNVYSSPDIWAAANNVNYGDGWPTNIHVSYQNINLTTPDAQVTQGNVTFMFFKTAAIPLPGVTLTQIEGAYNRIESGISF